MAEEQGDVPPPSPELYFDPIVELPLVVTKTLEENEETLFKMRAKLYRYDATGEPPEWKERGTGDVKILKHKTEEHVRILMRRDKTLKICANHYIQPYMELKPNSTSDRAWIWNTLADFADEEPKPELLAIKFANAENAQKFKEAFYEARDIAARFLKKQSETAEENESEGTSSDSDDSSEANTTPTKDTASKSTEEVSDKLSNLTVKEENQNSPSKEESKESEK
ncbi:ran-specific GTPase-activating protein [Trichonephila clavata]|uniref:Ran-specific GTPase-activating protein n=1 Tax=Trichonephila clavata TaxID=2740835 RepID=A0A8X6FWZ4_TRICU|nr:ran-specific GTPase-activating protein [Trichonephila clavata]